MQIANRVAVVTGASSGIGRSLAIELGLHGAKVVIAARSSDKLAETAAILSAYAIDHLVVPLDVTSEPSIHSFLERLQETYPTIDIFINNAGVGLFESIVGSVPQYMETVFKTNFWGPLYLMQQTMPILKNGMLVNISSAAAKYSPYRQGIYAASKAALDRVTEAMAIEEEGHLKTLLVVPDRTDTPFMKHVVGSHENVKLGLKLKFASTETVAKRIVHAIEKDRSICYTTIKSRVYTVLSAVSPSLVKSLIRKTSQ